MEVLVQLRVFPFQVGLEGLLLPGVDSPELPDCFFGSGAGTEHGGLALQDAPHEEDVFDVLGRENWNLVPPRTLGLDEKTRGRKLAQGLPHGSPAHAEFPGEGRFEKAFAGGKTVGGNETDDLPAGLVGS